jgi:hypothetical protein
MGGRRKHRKNYCGSLLAVEMTLLWVRWIGVKLNFSAIEHGTVVPHEMMKMGAMTSFRG